MIIVTERICICIRMPHVQLGKISVSLKQLTCRPVHVLV